MKLDKLSVFCMFSCVYCLFVYSFYYLFIFGWLPEMANKDEYNDY